MEEPAEKVDHGTTYILEVLLVQDGEEKSSHGILAVRGHGGLYM